MLEGQYTNCKTVLVLTKTQPSLKNPHIVAKLQVIAQRVLVSGVDAKVYRHFGFGKLDFYRKCLEPGDEVLCRERLT